MKKEILNHNNIDTSFVKIDQVYVMKVMTSFGYEIMLPRGFWFQTLDLNGVFPVRPQPVRPYTT